MHTEEEAKKLWCPHSRISSGENRYDSNNAASLLPGTSCIGSACMAWRWGHPTIFRGEEYLTKNHPLTAPNDWVSSDAVCDIPRGYCEIAGKPE